MPSSHARQKLQKISERYRRPSKARMNVRRYRVSGASHSSGMAATFCVRWLVTASSTTEPVVESASQCSTSPQRGGGAAGAAATAPGAGAALRRASKAQASANTPNSHDQPSTCSPLVR